MSVFRSWSDKDTFITDKSITSNFGASPILETWTLFNNNTNIKNWARILISFNISSCTANIINRDLPDIITDTTVSAYLNLFNCKHGDPLASNFNLNVYPVTSNWSESSGLENNSMSQTGFANAVSATNSTAWNASGGDYVIDANSATQYFPQGEENLRINITNIFKAWTNSQTANQGLMIRMSNTEENKAGSLSAFSYYTKKFYSRQTNTTNRPFISLEWPGAIQDFRNFVAFNSTANLFFYNIVNGQLTDLNAVASGDFPGNITLSGTSSSNNAVSAIKTSLTAKRWSKGIYQCNIGTMPLTSNAFAATSFKDNWYISASPTANYTFSFTTINPASGFDNYQTSSYRVILQNLSNVYDKNSQPRIRINIKDNSVSLVAATGATTAQQNFIATNSTWELHELDTDSTEIPADTLSFDKVGNFLQFNCQDLYANKKYYILLKLSLKGSTYIYANKQKWFFSVQ